MKTLRGLSGIYFRAKNEDTGKFEPIAFEDLSSEQQDSILETKDHEFVRNLAKELANIINEIGDQFDLTTKLETE